MRRGAAAPMLLAAAAQALLAGAAAGLHVDPALGDGMILQRGPAVARVWGNATAGATVEAVAVEAGTGKTVVSGQATVNSSGLWIMDLPASSTPYADTTLTVSSGNISVVLKGVGWGDVFLCSGQSNMVFAMGAMDNVTLELDDPDMPDIRMYLNWIWDPHWAKWTNNSQECGTGDWCRRSWVKSTNTSIPPASAVCYMTVKNVYRAFKGTVPMGLVESAHGGSAIQSWMSDEATAACPRLVEGQEGAGNLYRSYIEPLLPMRFEHVLWDQGESNDKDAQYSCRIQALIKDWRDKFQTDFGFYYVEIGYDLNISLAQRGALQLPKVGYAASSDISNIVHAPAKQPVAHRLALEILRMHYGEAVVSRGPVLVSAARSPDSKGVILQFSNSSSGMTVHGSYAGPCDGSSPFRFNANVSTPAPYNFTADGAVYIEWPEGVQNVSINDHNCHIRNPLPTTCFLYGEGDLPAMEAAIYYPSD